MGIGKLFKSLFSGSAAEPQPAAKPVEHKGLTIEAEPINEDGKFRTAGYISGDLNGETKRVRFIRADINSDLQIAIDHAFSKGKQIIDEQGPGLLERSNL
jgi:hypothetical protein